MKETSGQNVRSSVWWRRPSSYLVIFLVIAIVAAVVWQWFPHGGPDENTKNADADVRIEGDPPNKVEIAGLCDDMFVKLVDEGLIADDDEIQLQDTEDPMSCEFRSGDREPSNFDSAIEVQVSFDLWSEGKKQIIYNRIAHADHELDECELIDDEDGRTYERKVGIFCGSGYVDNRESSALGRFTWRQTTVSLEVSVPKDVVDDSGLDRVAKVRDAAIDLLMEGFKS